MKIIKVISITTLGYIFIAIICSAFIYQAIDFAPHDFSNYYFGCRFLSEGHFTQKIYFPHIFNQEIAALGYKNIFVSYAPNTPFLALFFYSFSFLSLASAKVVFNILSLGLFIYSIRNLFEHYQIKAVYLFLIPLVFLVPLRNNFLFGQVYLLLFFLLTEGFLAYKNERFLKMGIFWGIAILLKVFPVLLVGMLLFKKKFKAIVYLSSACIVLLGFSILISGFDIWSFYFNTVLPKSGNGEIAGEFVQNYQSMFMFLKYVFPTNIATFSTLLFLFKIIILVLSYFVSKQEKSELKLFSFWIIISLLLSPYGSTYTNLLLAFPMLFFARKNNFNFKSIYIIILFLLINSISIPYFSGFNPPFSFPKLWLLLALFFILIKEELQHINWKKSLLFIIPITVLYFFLIVPEEEIKSPNSISKENILTYDYTVKNGVLIYTYWTGKGENIKTTDILIKSIDTSSVSLINNQIFFKNKQVTFGNDHKLKPSIINGNQLLYLSDAKKGIGFYSLYKTPINSNK